MKYSHLKRVLADRNPVSGEFGFNPEFRCYRCKKAFGERALIEYNEHNRDESSRCPHCGIEDWGDNDEPVKTRAIRRWLIKSSKPMEIAA